MHIALANQSLDAVTQHPSEKCMRTTCAPGQAHRLPAELTGPVASARVSAHLSPASLRQQLPLDSVGRAVVQRARFEIARILNGDDDRLTVVVGPCSIHDPVATVEYGRRLCRLSAELQPDVRVIMRAYMEKPRSSLGWKGLVSDPQLDGSLAVDRGLRLARSIMLDILALGMPIACEFLDPIIASFLDDLVSWGSIGARTSESQVHRQFASGLAMPVGFKNGTHGDVQVAIDGVNVATHPHTFVGVSDLGCLAIAKTAGNPNAHVVLRGGGGTVNYDRPHVERALEAIGKAGLPARLMIDASHANSGKDFRRQALVLDDIAAQVGDGQLGIVGVMIESFLVEGRQELTDPANLRFGQSITDGCIGWDATESALRELAYAVRLRRTVHTCQARVA